MTAEMTFHLIGTSAVLVSATALFVAYICHLVSQETPRRPRRRSR